MQPTTNPVPRHLAIILDGNRRFAKRLMLKPWKGHEWGAQKLEKLLHWCREYDIKELTVYAFSVENFHRPKTEFDYLMNLFRKEYPKWANDPMIQEQQIRINFIGRIHMFPEDIQTMMRTIMEKTQYHANSVVNFAMAYGGRAEIIDATKWIAKEVQQGKITPEEINETSFANHLYMASDPDLIIRTGGEKRTSNFLLWQSNYSEWFFLEKMWPEFEKEDLVACLEEYKRRKRRFGK